MSEPATGTALPRLIASDLDGTFLSPDGSISELNARAVAVAREAGIHFIFATGRPPRWLDVLSTLPADERRVICSNGAIVHDQGAGSSLITHPIPLARLRAVLSTIREHLPDAAFAVEHGRSVGVEDRFRRVSDVPDPPGLMIAPAEELIISGPVLKLLVQHPILSADGLLGEVAPLIEDQVTVTHSSFGEFGMLELSALGVTKATTLAEYCRELGIDAADVAAFGDMPNDAAMLTWAGRSYVMADAHPSLDALDAARIGSNADSAVGRTILSWLGVPVPVDPEAGRRAAGEQ